MQSFGAMRLNSEETDKLRAVCLPEGIANKQLVGKSPATLLEAAGIPVPAKAPRLLIGIVKADDPWVTSEQLMPMLPIVTVSDFDSALTLALKVEEGLHPHRHYAFAKCVTSEPCRAHASDLHFCEKWPLLCWDWRWW